MPIVRIVQKGFETYSGIMEGVTFTNGVSDEPLSLAAAERLGAFMRVVDHETGEPISVGERLRRAREMSISSSGRLQRIERTPTGKRRQPLKKENLPSMDFDRQTLEGIADKSGIKGLREFAKPFGVNGRSIPEIIDSLMAKKQERAAFSQGRASAKSKPKPESKPKVEIESEEEVMDIVDDLDEVED